MAKSHHSKLLRNEKGGDWGHEIIFLKTKPFFRSMGGSKYLGMCRLESKGKYRVREKK